MKTTVRTQQDLIRAVARALSNGSPAYERRMAQKVAQAVYAFGASTVTITKPAASGKPLSAQ